MGLVEGRMKAREEIQAVIDHGRKEGERVVAASRLIARQTVAP